MTLKVLRRIGIWIAANHRVDIDILALYAALSQSTRRNNNPYYVDLDTSSGFTVEFMAVIRSVRVSLAAP
jgi:hypothetical protein